MSNPTTPNTPTTRAAIHKRHSRPLQLPGLTLLALLALLSITSSAAYAGTYVINNCPSAPIPNGNAGPWQIYGAVTATKSSCSGGTGDFIGPLGGEMAPNSSSGAIVSVPAESPITITKVSVYWYSPQSTTGAHTYSQVLSNTTSIGGQFDPEDHTYTVANYTLPTGATNFNLQTYCSSDDGVQGCLLGSGSEIPDLKMFGSQITLQDSTPPSGNVTGGTLADGGTLTGTQSLNYTASDPSSGVRLLKLLIDGTQVATNDYTAQCPYQNFLACPADITDTLNWNTATVPDGQHFMQAIVEDAAKNTTTLYQTAITTNNPPKNTSPPTLNTQSQPSLGSAISAQPGSWTAPTGAGNITYSYQWEDCDTQGNNCQPIPDAENAGYTPIASDLTHTLRVQVTAADNDGKTTQASATTSTVLSTATSTGSSVAPNGPSNSPGPQVFGGIANGTPASEAAILTVAVSKPSPIHLSSNIHIHSSFHDRALKLNGRLTNSVGQPISGATLDVLQQISGSDTLTLLKHVTTGPGGGYTLTIPAGPSRRIEIAYRAFTSEPNYAATATVTETVEAGVHLSITPLSTGSTGIITVKGNVYGPIPPQGALVQLHVYYHAKWLTIRALRTNRHGAFHIEYQFEGAIGHFPFQAEIPTGQASFPYTRGYSNTVKIATE